MHRDLTSMKLRNPFGQIISYDILQVFPFSSDTKRMGIIVKDTSTNEILFLMKGADTVMNEIIQYSDWLQEQCDSMARSGLRTLVIARKFLSEGTYFIPLIFYLVIMSNYVILFFYLKRSISRFSNKIRTS